MAHISLFAAKSVTDGNSNNEQKERENEICWGATMPFSMF
jgi:hypothetical protein